VSTPRGPIDPDISGLTGELDEVLGGGQIMMQQWFDEAVKLYGKV
jgi:hypothetical protein